jgi:CubicO group peptidase (beta-lactamase class C family)
VLALIVEKKTGLPFAGAVEQLVFRPMGLSGSGVDDDSKTAAKHVARGYEPDGTYGLKPAAAIYWSAKTGNASVYATAGDEVRFVSGLFQGPQLSLSSREAILDTTESVGYGWFKSENKRFGETAYYMNGRAPGFASFILRLPHTQTTVVVLSNIYSSATSTIGNDIAAITLGLPYEPFRVGSRAPDSAELKSCTGAFHFGPDFYQPNAEVAITSDGPELFMRWPSGSASALIPLGHDRFVDRSYWEEVRIERDSSGRPSSLIYGQFQGKATNPQ